MKKPLPQIDPGAKPLDEALVERYAAMAGVASEIDSEYYRTYNVKRGLRNADGSVRVPEVLRPFLGGLDTIR